MDFRFLELSAPAGPPVPPALPLPPTELVVADEEAEPPAAALVEPVVEGAGAEVPVLPAARSTVFPV